MAQPYDVAGPTLGSYLAVLRRRKWWVILATLVCAGGVFGYSYVQPKVYSASAEILVQTQGASITGVYQQPITQTEVLTELQLVTSAPVKAAVAREFGSVPHITAAEVGQTNVMSVTASAPSPVRAAAITNAYATAFIKYERSVTINNLTAAETQLNQQISSITSQVKGLGQDPQSATEVTALLSQATVLKGQLAELEVNGAVNTGGVELVTPATPPSSPSSPRPLRDAVLGLVLGLLLGIALSFVIEHMDDAIYMPEEVEQLTPGARVLALVPMVSAWKHKERTFLVTKSEPTAAASEAYLSLRTSLQFATLRTATRKLLVTSPRAKEGKSSTVSNLGVVLASAGQRVVLVSADLRKPRLGEFFGLYEGAGITTVLLGRHSLEETLQAVPGVPGLSMLGAGEPTSDPTGVLTHDRFAAMLDELSAMFDLVLIDSPPLLPVTDAAIISQLVDTTLLIVAAGQTRSRDVSRAFEALSLVHATTLGVVLNEVSRSGGTGYAYRPYYQYAPQTAPLAPSNGNGARPADTAWRASATTGSAKHLAGR